MSSGNFRCAIVLGLFAAAAARAQFVEPITSFETDRDGNPTLDIPASYGDLQVIMFQDPRFPADNSTNGFISPDGTFSPNDEESAVSSFYGGSGGTTKALAIFWSWVDGTDTTRWSRVRTFQSPRFPNPSIHLGGKVRLKVRIVDAGFGNSNLNLGFALLVRETGQDAPQGFNGGETGALEFVGVSGLTGANTAVPTPAPLAAYSFNGVTSSGDNNFVLLEFDLPALQTSGNVVGWTAMGGDGTLSAAPVNRGVLDSLVVMPLSGDVGRDVLFLVDQVEFEAPVVDPVVKPRLGTPIIAGNTTVRVNDVLSSSTDVTLEVDRNSAGSMTFTADETYSQNPGGFLFVDAPFPPLAMPLAVGDRVRARQTNPSGTSDYSTIVTVNPPASFSLTLSLDEDGNGGVAPADFEWVGATGVSGSAGVQGKPVFANCGVWQKFEFSLIPGVEPVINFAGGNGMLQPDGGFYNVDSFFMTIDPTGPQVGPYEVFIDHIYVTQANGSELVIGDSEFVNPLPNFRGQSTFVAGSNSSTLSNVGSYDGVQATRIAWTWPDAQPSNTTAPFRPAPNFADTATAVGLYVYVAGPAPAACNAGGPTRPVVNGPIIGNQTMVRVTADATATSVQLYVNGVAFGAPVTPSAGTANIPTSGLVIGNSISATQVVGGNTSQFAIPRAVQGPAAPTLCAPLITGATTVTVSNVSTATFATASLVEVFSNGTSIGSAPGGTSTVIVPVSPLVQGAVITAKQTINGAVSPPSGGITVTAPVPPPTVVINELQYDDQGNDDREFVELYNFGSSPVDISGWILQASDTVGPPADDNPDYIIPGAPGSNTTVIAAGGYYVIGHSTVPNVNLIITQGFNTAVGSWENDNEALQLLTGSGQIADTVVYELNKGPVAICPTEFGLWGNMQSNNATATRQAMDWSRWNDGYDTGDNGTDFGHLAITPGTTNNQPDAGTGVEAFEAGAVDADVPGYTGSFVNLRFIDPTVASTANPNVIAASGGGTGGKAAIAWDNTGGGNMVTRISEARFSNAYSLDVYISADSSFVSTSTSGEHEAWSIGLGTTDTFYNDNGADSSVPPIPDGGVAGANGDTGLAWKYLKWEDANTGNVGGQRLLLVNENDGGADGVTLFTVDPSHLTTGWHHLTLTRAQDNVSAAFDTDSFSGTVSGNGPSTFVIGYRETIVNNALTRPPTIDNLQITVPADIIAANPPIAAANPYEPGQPYRDVLQNRNTTNTVDQGIGAAGTPVAGPIQYSPILVTYSAAPTPTPMLGNVTIACTRAPCPAISSVTPQAGNTFAIGLSGVIPPLGCTTITFPDGKRVQYRSHPGNVNMDNASNTQDLLALVQAINNGSANQSGNLARYNIDRAGGVNTQDLLREVQLLNGVNTTQSFNGATVDACPP